jgi:uncharacterized protein HemY
MKCWATVLVFATAAGSARAGEQPPPFPTLEVAVRALGDDRFAVREKATAYLWSRGRSAEELLEQTLLGPDVDLETAIRARQILDKFRWSIYPDTPPDILKFIEDFRQAPSEKKQEVIVKILSRGPVGLRTASRLVAREPVATVRANLAASLETAFLKLLPALLEQDAFDELETLLQDAGTQESERLQRHLAACLILRGRVDARLPYYRAQAERPGGEPTARLLTYLYRAKGDTRNLRWAAQRSGDEALRQAVLQELGAWNELAALGGQLAGRRTEAGMHALIHRLANRAPEFDLVMNGIFQRGKNLKEGHEDVWWEVKPLLYNGRTAQGLELLLHGQRYYTAFEILCAQTRYREAFALADKRGGRDQWLEALRIKTLHELGEREQAVKLLQRAGAAWKIDPKRTYTDHSPIPNAEFLLSLDEDAIAHSLELFRGFPKTDPRDIVSYLFNLDSTEANEWWFILRQIEPREEPRATLLRLRRLLNRQLARQEFEALVHAGQEILRQQKREVWLPTMSETCLGYDRPDLARHCLEKRAAWQNDAASWLELGRFHFKRQEWRQAADSLAAALRKQPTMALAAYLRGWALGQLGEKAAGERHLKLASWMPLGNHEERNYFATFLEQHGFQDEAYRQFALLRLLGSDDEYHPCHALVYAAREANRRQEHLRAADLYERAATGVLQRNSSYLYGRSWISQPHRARLSRARGLLAAGDIPSAWREMQICQSIHPGNINLPIAALPELARRGEHAKADELFQSVFAHLGVLCRDFPRCADFHNQRARLAARCRRELGIALEHSRTAVKLTPQNAGYLETLAEVHFQRREALLALEAINQAVALEPDNSYLRKQQQRMRSDDATASVPEL